VRLSPASALCPYTTILRSRWPELPCGDPGLLARGGGIGDAAVAADDPVVARHLARGAVVDPGDHAAQHGCGLGAGDGGVRAHEVDRKSTRLTSSHVKISYA